MPENPEGSRLLSSSVPGPVERTSLVLPTAELPLPPYVRQLLVDVQAASMQDGTKRAVAVVEVKGRKMGSSW